MAEDDIALAAGSRGCGTNYIHAPAGWSCTDPNPFTDDGGYGHAWSAFCIEDRDDGQFFTGRSDQGPFCARFGRGVDHLENRLADFLRYECAHGRKVILSFPDELDGDGVAARALARTPAPSVVRVGDPEMIVHSTTHRAWASIRADGELRAASQLTRGDDHSPELVMPSEVMRYYEAEPPEYADYIMFGKIHEIGPEVVVASRAAGRFVVDPDATYKPGIRLYFDHHRLIRDGLATRDGLHTTKVHHRLPLTPYLLAAVSAADLDPGGRMAPWTLRAFVEKSNASIACCEAIHTLRSC
jgi:hypothetical protein